MRTILSEINQEFLIKKSRFIACAYPIESSEQAAKIIQSLWKAHPLATHICYAFVVGGTARINDDGEPSGTAGKPILNVITKNGLDGVLVAIVRYFGGIKLGAGGLTRAYSCCASQVIADARTAQMLAAIVLECQLDYNEYNIINHALAENSRVKVVCAEFLGAISLRLCIALDQLESIKELICAKAQRKIEFSELEKCYMAVNDES